jgi:hypothetical protein
MTKLLLTQNANVNVLDGNGGIPLDICISGAMDSGTYFRQAKESASVLLRSGGRLTKFGASNLETFLNELEVYQIDVTEDFKPELQNQAATPWPEPADRETSLDVFARGQALSSPKPPIKTCHGTRI